MKIFRSAALLVFAVSLLGACKKNKIGELTLQFHAQLSGTDCDLMSPFTNTLGQQLKVELLKFYISDITLINDKGEEKMVDEIALITLDSYGDASLDIDVPVGDYTTLKFGIGVPTTLNEADPSTYNEEGNPLNTTEGMYWDMNAMYRFLSIDGRYDIEPDGTDDGTFSYHTGFDDSYRNYEFAVAAEIKKDQNSALTINIDLQKILSAAGNEMDVVNTPYYHGSTADFYLSVMLSDNFQSAISVE